MYCPQCREEFQDWVKTCPDCDRPLVAELPPEPSHQAPEVRVVLQTSDPDLLPVAASALRAAGIPFWTPGESTMDLLPIGQVEGWVTSNLISTAILVPADRYEEALALLETRAEIVEPRGEEDLESEIEEEIEDEEELDEDDERDDGAG
jgi:hypothetical protein